jgi:antirestriction protein ArdC
MHPASFVTGDPRFCTYQQASSKGWQVRKGEKAVPVMFYKPLVKGEEQPDDASDSPAQRMGAVLRVFNVFHTTQIDGVPAYVAPTIEEAPWQRPDAALQILRNCGAKVTVGGDRAFYSPTTDHINLPPDHAFYTPHDWAATTAHELGHWTGAQSRLNRDLTGTKGSKSYALEELRAELNSAFIGAVLNLPCPIENHASYLDHWIGVLKSDKREIFRAAADAQKITNYLLNFHPDYQLALEGEILAEVRHPQPALSALTA